jgi:hypothetical protein
VDAQTCRLIVLDRTVDSMTEFKQIIGRENRVHEDTKKIYFMLIDFRGATNHLAYPDFDGGPVQIYEPGPNDPRSRRKICYAPRRLQLAHHRAVPLLFGRALRGPVFNHRAVHLVSAAANSLPVRLFSHIVGQSRRDVAGLTPQLWSRLARAAQISACNMPSSV